MRRLITCTILLMLSLSVLGCTVQKDSADTSTHVSVEQTTEQPTISPKPVPTPVLVDYVAYTPAKDAALNALKGILDESRSCLYVYRDFGATENHFTQKAKMFGSNGELVKNMD